MADRGGWDAVDARDDGRDRGRLPGWLVGTGWGLLGLSAVGLPVALVVAAIDTVRRRGQGLAWAVVLAGIVLAGVLLVLAVERGLTWAVNDQDWSAWTVLWVVLGLVALVLLGVLVPPVGLVLVSVGVVVAVLLGPVVLAWTAWVRWRSLPAGHDRRAATTVEVREAAERRRAAVRRRHDRTRQAVEAGLVGPGFTRRQR